MACMTWRWWLADRQVQIAPLKLDGEEGGAGWKWRYSVFKKGKSVQATSLPRWLGHKKDTARQKKDGQTHQQRRFLTASLGCWPNISIVLNSVSAACFHNCVWQILYTVIEKRCHWNHIQITPNGDTSDSCVHKCFSLGLSWLWQILQHTNHCEFTSLSYG